MSPDRRTFIVKSAGALAAIALAPEDMFATPVVRERPGKVALIGAGVQGRDILDQIMKIGAVSVGAVCDVIPSRVTSALDHAAGAEGFADYTEMLAKHPEIDAVFIATPTHLHKQIVADVAAAGRHIYCEAPLAHTAEDARAIAAAAAANAGRVFQSGLTARSNPLVKRARTVVRSDAVRDVVSMYAQRHLKTSWRFTAPPGGNSNDANWRLDPAVSLGLEGEFGTHAIDIMRYMRGSDPMRVNGSGMTRLWDDGRKVPDTVRFVMEWPDDVALSFSGTLANSFGGEHQVVHGTNAAVKTEATHAWMFKESDAATQGWEVYATRQQFGGDEGIVLIADATQLAAQGLLKEGMGLEHPPLYYAIADFFKSIDEKAPIAATAEDGVKSTMAGIAAHNAVATRASVDIRV